MQKKLYRSRKERLIAGVCGGLAAYFDLDPTIVRVIFVLLTLANGIGILIYIILAIVVPREGSPDRTTEETVRENIIDIKQTAQTIGKEIHDTFEKEEETTVSDKSPQRRNMLGIALVIIGIVILLGTLDIFRWLNWGYIWSGIIIVVGLIIIFTAGRKS